MVQVRLGIASCVRARQVPQRKAEGAPGLQVTFLGSSCLIFSFNYGAALLN